MNKPTASPTPVTQTQTSPTGRMFFSKGCVFALLMMLVSFVDDQCLLDSAVTLPQPLPQQFSKGVEGEGEGE